VRKTGRSTPLAQREAWLARLTITGSLCTDAVGLVHRIEKKRNKVMLYDRHVSIVEDGLLGVTSGALSGMYYYQRAPASSKAPGLKLSEDDVGASCSASAVAQTVGSLPAIAATTCSLPPFVSTKVAGSAGKVEMGTQTDSVPMPECMCTCQDTGMNLLDGSWALEAQVSKGKKALPVMRINGLHVVMSATGTTHKLDFDGGGALEFMGSMVLFNEDDGMLGLQCKATGAMTTFVRLGDLR